MEKLKLLVLICLLPGVTAKAQNIGVNTNGNTPDASALLDVDASPSNNKGMLIPRIALQALNTAAPISAPATSLLVYNTATAGTAPNTVTPGFYYWNGSSWQRLTNGNGNDWSPNGNSGTIDGTHFIGTTDNIPLNFRVNNNLAGKISSNGTSLFGYEAGISNTSWDITAIGTRALYSNTNAQFNTTVGAYSLYSSTTSSKNTAIGYSALGSFNAAGEGNNMAAGYSAMSFTTTGINNTAVGSNAMIYHTTGNNNTAFGYRSMQNSKSGNYNIGIGSSALYGGTGGLTGSQNAALGIESLAALTSGWYNIAFGTKALGKTTTGDDNSAFGSFALFSNVSGINNIAIGYEAGYSTLGSSNVFIGYQAGYSETGSNKLYISNSNSATPLIYGDFSKGEVTIKDVIKLTPRTSAPTAPAKGTMYFDNATNKLRVYDGTAWQNCW